MERRDAVNEDRELICMCLWDVFSNNHSVTAIDGREVDIGSFRGAAAFLADLANAEIGGARYDYMDFYMGTIRAQNRADLAPVYRAIFRRLRGAGSDWEYRFPRLGLVEMGPATSDPEADPAEEIEKRRAVDELRADFEEGERAAREAARDLPAPATVAAYRAVYGEDPAGWPPWD